MDAIRVAKVENVAFRKPSGALAQGTIHLTAHHLIFQYDTSGEKELWVPYPLISLVTRLPQTLQGQNPLNFRCRTFESFSISFSRESDAIDVFESVKELTVATSVEQLYAFFYKPNPPLSAADGWSLYSPREEFGRMGVGSRTKAWRFTDINKDFSFCPTYPARLVVPTKISDTTLQYASKYRSKCRIPVLTYLHWANYGSITRSSQPMVGLTQNRSIQDEKVIEAIFQSHYSPDSRAANVPVYGATATNLIIDARPTTNAMANTAKGAGTENMDHYKEGKKAYLGIDNIHAMRDSLAKVVEALREADTTLANINNDLSEEISGLAVLDRHALRRSGWLRHLAAIVEGTLLITRNVHVNSSHVLIHCSDGWDRTSQLSSLSQLCLDPFYRTIRGFEILVEKDWLSFGHRFMDRCGHLSSDKFFVSPTETVGGGGGTEAAQAFLASVQNRFASQHHIKETSPVFHQFLESVRQVQRQFPERFEFNQRFLSQLYYHLYSCQFGTFLFNSERERRHSAFGRPPCERTVSVWDFLNSTEELEQNRNPNYDPSLDDPASRLPKADMGVLFPNPKDIRFWHELYGRTDEEMNGRIQPAQIPTVEVVGPIDENADDPITQRTGTPSTISLPPSPSRSPPPSLSPPTRTPSRSSTLGPMAPPPPSASPSYSTSMPEVSSEPATTWTETFKPFISSISQPSTSYPASAPSSPNRTRAQRQPDIFGSSGVKSMWGKLSSNASAALSVVQEAYSGAARDLRNTGSGEADSDLPEKTAELRSRDTISNWGAELPTPRAPSGSAFSTQSNPWASVKSHPSPMGSFDNPWGSVRASASTPRQSAPLGDTFYSAGTLPDDPTVARPGLTGPLSTTKSGSATPAGLSPPLAISSSTSPKPPARAQDSADLDPLGVGLL